ncbi:MAG: DUF6797 domain-containing protein [Planctomycetota bacterium]
MKYLLTSLAAACLFLAFTCQEATYEAIDRSAFSYLLPANALADYEVNIDHAAFVRQEAEWDEDWGLRNRAVAIYRTHCFSCHGNHEAPGSLPNSKKFWAESFRNGNDPYSLYQTISRGHGQMPPQLQLVPSQKYAVIAFLRNEFIKQHNPAQYFEVTPDYLNSLPEGNAQGPDAQPYRPWAELDYGNWLMRCYEMSDEDDPEKVISRGPAPLPHEDYRDVNFAYKGIAMRLDPGEGGVAAGNTFAMFDHDLLRFVGAWTGEGFIDWEDILLDDQHNVYPRTVGKRQFANPVTPGWANPKNGSFEDPRFFGSDGRQYGPLPQAWAHYQGLYRYEDRVVIAYTVGNAEVLETYDLIEAGETPIISRTLNLRLVRQKLTLRVAPAGTSVVVKGEGVSLATEDGYVVARIRPGSKRAFALYLSARPQAEVEALVASAEPGLDLRPFTKGSPPQHPEVLQSPIIQGADTAAYAVDVLVLPDNPWLSRVRLTGIDFVEGGETAIVSTIDGEIWQVEGITQDSGMLRWTRIATGLFQPLGVKIKDGDIYVGCRDQIVILRDLNGDGETDFYESFNSDHQVTEHYHEFAMGLQTDEAGNFYYAKSGRHARKSLVPRHGTLIQVSADGKQSKILANGFRAANGVCLNPDGSFYVTDQQGFWNPMNRINRVTQGGFYGNMWGYGAPEDSSDAAMVQPMAWIDMKYDRSPAELVWAESDRWGPLNGGLLNLSYGYGKIFHVMPQMVDGVEQGGMVELPVPQFPTGIMRARFNPTDGQMYVCGMAAWATNQMIQVGGLYRVRYTGKPLHLPTKLEALSTGMRLTFSEALDPTIATDPTNFQINTWDLKRTSDYGSDRYNEQSLNISQIDLSEDGTLLLLHLPDLQPTWVMEILYELKGADGKAFQGAIQNTVYGSGEGEKCEGGYVEVSSR